MADPNETYAHEGSKFLYKPANEEAPKLFAQENERLAPILGNGVNIERFGSTAVRRLGGEM